MLPVPPLPPLQVSRGVAEPGGGRCECCFAGGRARRFTIWGQQGADLDRDSCQVSVCQG